MRLPAYTNAEMSWTHQCDVLFDGVDFGPDLIYCDFEFAPAKVRTRMIEVPGRSGAIDQTEALTGYPAYDGIQGTLTLGVVNPQHWITPALDAAHNYVSPEARFLRLVNGRRCKITFVNSNLFWLSARPTIKKYTKFGIVWQIVLDIDAEPYWYEVGMQGMEWQLAGTSAAIDTFLGAVVTQKSSDDVSCTWSSALGWFGLRAPVGGWAMINLLGPHSGINKAKHYRFACRAAQGPGYWELYNDAGQQITDTSNFTGTGSLYLKVYSQTNKYVACVFLDISIVCLDGASLETDLRTLDSPCTRLDGFATAPCTVAIDGTPYELPAGNNITIYGLQIPPRSVVPVVVTSLTASSGGLMYQRGAFSCTL